MVEIIIPKLRVDLTRPCSILCDGGCGTIMARGDTVIFHNGKVYCQDCGKKVGK